MGQGWVRKEAMILRCSWIKLCSTALLQPLGSIGCEATLTAWLHPVSKLEEEIGVPLAINLIIWIRISSIYVYQGVYTSATHWEFVITQTNAAIHT